jgi:hypothetical protein
MSGPAIKVDDKNAQDCLTRIKMGTRRVLSRELRNMARDAALLARAHAPSNMNRDDIKWGLIGINAYVDAKGGPAAYNSGKGAIPGGPRGSTFSHPVFPKAGSDRKTWNWSDTQATKPFIDDAVREIQQDASVLLEVAFQEFLDTESL